MQDIELFSARLKDAVKNAGGADVISRQTNIPRRTLETYLAGQTEPKYGKIIALSEACDVSLEWLMVGKTNHNNTENADSWADIPLYDGSLSPENTSKILSSHTESCGFLQESAELLTHIKFRRPSIEKYSLKIEALAAVRVSGKAMLPLIDDMDTVLIDTRESALRADDLGLFIIGPQLIVRRLQYLPDGSAQLVALQPDFSPISFPATALSSIVIGRVVWVAHWLLSV